jgi:hypothetical protein
LTCLRLSTIDWSGQATGPGPPEALGDGVPLSCPAGVPAFPLGEPLA